MAADPAEIEEALLKRLLAFRPAWTTRMPGMKFKPKPDQAWQRGTCMPGRPDTVAFGDGAYSRMFGVYQVDLFYPASSRRNFREVAERASAMRDHFFPIHRRGLTLTEGATQVYIETLPAISAVDETDPSFASIHIDIVFRVDDAPA